MHWFLLISCDKLKSESLKKGIILYQKMIL